LIYKQGRRTSRIEPEIPELHGRFANGTNGNREFIAICRVSTVFVNIKQNKNEYSKNKIKYF
jgi:hypothetical protein